MTAVAMDLDLLREHVEGGEPVADAAELGALIAAEITRQKLNPGDLLPGEHGLCEAFGVSRAMVRRTLLALERDGTIRRIRGKGILVGDHMVGERFVPSVRGLYEDAALRGQTVRSTVLRLELAPAPPDVALWLELADDALVVVLERIRLLGDEPWCLATSWLPEHLAEVLADADLAGGSLYAVLARHGAPPASITRTLEGRAATPDQAARLQLGPKPVVMTLRSLAHTADGRPLEYCVAHHRADRSRFEFSSDDAGR